MAQARIGCSGWMYRDWRDRVYPAGTPTRRWFAEYAARFDTVELNATFYRLPTASTVERWAAAAPPGFVYAVKVGAFGSHRMKLRDPERWLGNHLDRVRRLGPSLGPNLVQLPPHWHRDVPRLRAFLEVAPRDVRWAVELRDPSWLHEDVYSTLAEFGAALCWHDLLPGLPRIVTTSWTYLRFHGPDARHAPYRGRYTGRRLRPWVDRIARWLDGGVEVFGYFNNDVDAAAVVDATWLRDRVDPRWEGAAVR